MPIAVSNSSPLINPASGAACQNQGKGSPEEACIVYFENAQANPVWSNVRFHQLPDIVRTCSTLTLSVLLPIPIHKVKPVCPM